MPLDVPEKKILECQLHGFKRLVIVIEIYFFLHTTLLDENIFQVTKITKKHWIPILHLNYSLKIILNVILHTFSTQKTAPSILTTFITYSCDMIARGISFTESATLLQTFNSKIASGTPYWKISKLSGIYGVNLLTFKYLRD